MQDQQESVFLDYCWC